VLPFTRTQNILTPRNPEEGYVNGGFCGCYIISGTQN